MDVENCRLHQSLEVLPDKPVAILHHVCSADWGDAQAIKISTLQPNGENVLLDRCPVVVEVVPRVFRVSEQDGV